MGVLAGAAEFEEEADACDHLGPGRLLMLIPADGKTAAKVYTRQGQTVSKCDIAMPFQWTGQYLHAKDCGSFHAAYEHAEQAGGVIIFGDVAPPFMNRNLRRAFGKGLQRRLEGFQGLLLDFDAIPNPYRLDPTRDPLQAAEWIWSFVPEPIRSCSRGFRWSSSTGINGIAQLSIHFRVWLDRPLDAKDRARLVKGISSLFRQALEDEGIAPGKAKIDERVVGDNHITFLTVFDGLDDPFPAGRSGFIQGHYDSVGVEDLEAELPVAMTAVKAQTAETRQALPAPRPPLDHRPTGNILHLASGAMDVAERKGNKHRLACAARRYGEILHICEARMKTRADWNSGIPEGYRDLVLHLLHADAIIAIGPGRGLQAVLHDVVSRGLLPDHEAAEVYVDSGAFRTTEERGEAHERGETVEWATSRGETVQVSPAYTYSGAKICELLDVDEVEAALLGLISLAPTERARSHVRRRRAGVVDRSTYAAGRKAEAARKQEMLQAMNITAQYYARLAREGRLAAWLQDKHLTPVHTAYLAGQPIPSATIIPITNSVSSVRPDSIRREERREKGDPDRKTEALSMEDVDGPSKDVGSAVGEVGRMSQVVNFPIPGRLQSAFPRRPNVGRFGKPMPPVMPKPTGKPRPNPVPPPAMVNGIQRCDGGEPVVFEEVVIFSTDQPPGTRTDVTDPKRQAWHASLGPPLNQPAIASRKGAVPSWWHARMTGDDEIPW